MCSCFGRCNRWLEKFATGAQSGIVSAVSTMPFLGAVVYRVRSSCCGFITEPFASVVIGIKYWIFGGFVLILYRYVLFSFRSRTFAPWSLFVAYDLILGAILSFRDEWIYISCISVCRIVRSSTTPIHECRSPFIQNRIAT